MDDATAFRRPESVLVVIHTRKLDCLLLKRVVPADFWQSVTGTLDWGETPAAAATREVIEETGLDPTLLADAGRAQSFPILPAWRDRFAPEVSENLEHVWYLPMPKCVPIELNAAEHSEYGWFPLEQAIAKASSWSNRDALIRLRPS